MTADPGAQRTRAQLLEILREAGVDGGSVEAADRDGLLALLAVERFVLPEPFVYDIDALAQATGIPTDRLAQLWRALGYPTPEPGEPAFTETDRRLLENVRRLVASGIADPEVVINMTRVLGSSMARIADAQAEVVARRHEVGDLVAGAEWFGDLWLEVMEQTWRRHLQMAARSRLSHESDLAERHATVGFADLVGFTALSQQLDAGSLAGVVDRFETVAFDTIHRFGGHVVKMIGDEVMFDVDDPVAAVRCGLALASSYHEADDLSDVRVGLARGSVIEREGDLYGPTVNLAHRITSIAFPGTVVVDQAVHDAIAGVDEFSIRALLPRRLKNIGRVPLWAVRPAGADRTGAEEREHRRARRRARVGEIVRDVAQALPTKGGDDEGEPEPGGTEPATR